MNVSKNKLKEVKDILPLLKPNSKIFIHGTSATPNCFLQLLDEVKFPITLYHLHTAGNVEYLKNPNVNVKAFFLGANMRNIFNGSQIDYIPCSLSQIPQLFRDNVIPLDLAIFQTSEVDEHGYVSLGTSVDIAVAALEKAKLSVAIINQNMPRIFGDGVVPISKFHYVTNFDSPMLECVPHMLTKEEIKIGEYISNLVEDGSTIQTGIGNIPDAVLAALTSHKNLGVHSEMYADGVMNLIKKGIVTNSEKKIHPGKTVGSFAMGSREFYEFLNNNPNILHLESSFVNNPLIIAKNPKVISINSAIEVDLTGQVCADSIGPKIISGTGGQMDFMLGSSWSKGGKSIMAFSSESKGRSKIVSRLSGGAGVVTPRAYVHYVVTEFGVADLFGKSLYERAKALIAIAHPKHQETLLKSVS